MGPGTVFAFFLMLGIREAVGQYRHFVFEKPTDFPDNRFTCIQPGAAASCVIQQANQGEDLPSYFPAPYRQLPGPLMYVETTVNNNQGHFRLESNVQIPGYIVSFRGEYFTHSSNAIGCQNATEDDWHPWPPASPSEDPPRWQEGKWLYVTKSKLQRFGFFVLNNRDNGNKHAVFRRLEIVIDEEPNLLVRIDSLGDAAALGVECVSPSGDPYLANSACKLKSVTETSDLPPYFSNAFRSLAPPNGTNVMYVEGEDNALASHLLLFTLPIQFNPDPVGVLSFSAAYYTETEGGLGYGPILEGSSDRWIPLSRGTNSQFITYKSYDLERIENVVLVPNSKVGFLVMNDKANTTAVFLRLEIRAWFTRESVIEDPSSSTSLVSTTTTERTSGPSTSSCPISPTSSPTEYTDGLTDSSNLPTSTTPVSVTNPSVSTTASEESTTDSISETTETTGSRTETDSEPGLPTTPETTVSEEPSETAETSLGPETTTVDGRGSALAFGAPAWLYVAILVIVS